MTIWRPTLLRKLIINLLICLSVLIFVHYCTRKQRLRLTHKEQNPWQFPYKQLEGAYSKSLKTHLSRVLCAHSFYWNMWEQVWLFLLGPCLWHGHNPTWFIHITDISGLRQGQRRQQAPPVWEFCPREIFQGFKCCATVFSFVNQDLGAFSISKGCGMIKGLTQIDCSNNIICYISMEHSLGA